MKNETKEMIKNANMSTLREFINCLNINPNVNSIDISYNEDIVEILIAELPDYLIDFLSEIDENNKTIDELESIALNQLQRLKEIDIEVISKYAQLEDNFFNFKRWEFSYVDDMMFSEWAEIDTDQLFQDLIDGEI
jgi:hypothetical protein